MLSFLGSDDLPLSWLRPDDVPDARDENNNHVAKSKQQHATCPCITRTGNQKERRRCKFHKNLIPASTIHHVAGKRQRVTCSCKTRNGHPKDWQGSCAMQNSSKISKADPVSGLALALNLTRALTLSAFCSSSFRALSLSLSRSQSHSLPLFLFISVFLSRFLSLTRTTYTFEFTDGQTRHNKDEVHIYLK